MACSK